jgi:hypothetical protein
MRKLDGANGTKALEKAEELQRTEQRPSQNKRTRTKNLFFEKAPTKVRYSRGVQKRKKSSSLAWTKEVISSSFPHKSFFQKARARQKR